jgi:hypothetical protein
MQLIEELELLLLAEVLVELLDALELLVLDDIELLELEPPPGGPPGPAGPFILDIPVICKVFGNNGSISANQTVVYIPGLPSAAVLPGSRLPHWAESAQHGLYVPQNGPAAQAAQPIYSGFCAMYSMIPVM